MPWREKWMAARKDRVQKECLIHLATWGSGWANLALSLVTRVLLGVRRCTRERWQTKLEIHLCVCVCVTTLWALVCLYSNNCCFSVFVLVYVCPAGSCMLDSKHAAQKDSGVKLLVQTPPLKLNHMSIRFLSLSLLSLFLSYRVGEWKV